MKLSIKKTFGAIHVRPGRLLRVAHDHQVPIASQAVNEPPQYLRTFEVGTKWVTATVGSLALEIVAVKTGVVMGYAYLSGPAIRLNLYRQDAPPHWFSPARAIIGSTLSLPGAISGAGDYSAIVSGFMALKYSGADVVVIELEVDSEANMHDAMRLVQAGYCHIPADMTDEQAKVDTTAAHMIGAVHVRKTKMVGMIHFQPPRDASEWCCAAFQNDLVRAGNWDVVDPWAAKQAS